MNSATSPPGPVHLAIQEKVRFPQHETTDRQCVLTALGQLTMALQPDSLSISNDSWQHRHHAPMRAEGGGNGETRS